MILFDGYVAGAGLSIFAILIVKRYAFVYWGGLINVSAQIERHSRLERQGTLYGCTIVIFDKKAYKCYFILVQKSTKNYHKFLNLNRAPELSLRGYGI